MTASRTLLVHCHPDPDSLSAAIRDEVRTAATARGGTCDLIDLYADGFDPVMGRAEWRGYHDETANLAPIHAHAERIAAADTLLFTYPTWWFGLPAMLKGWLDRVLVPGFAFGMPGPDHGPRPGLTHIRRIGVFTTCGASRGASFVMGMPGRRTLLRGLRANCHPAARTCYHALYRIDSASDAQRGAFLAKVPARVERLMGRRRVLPAASLARRRVGPPSAT